jgi:hypothetical protein
VTGELVFGGFDDGLFVFLTNAADGFSAVGWDFKGHKRFRTDGGDGQCVDNVPTGSRQVFTQ